MNWIFLNEKTQLRELTERSFTRPQVIFKHSTRCSISSMALNRLERATAPDSMDFYLLDLLRHRDLSNNIADTFGVHHESPQVLLIRNGECIYDESHSGIHMDELWEQAQSAA